MANSDSIAGPSTERMRRRLQEDVSLAGTYGYTAKFALRIFLIAQPSFNPSITP